MADAEFLRNTGGFAFGDAAQPAAATPTLTDLTFDDYGGGRLIAKFTGDRTAYWPATRDWVDLAIRYVESSVTPMVSTTYGRCSSFADYRLPPAYLQYSRCEAYHYNADLYGIQLSHRVAKLDADLPSCPTSRGVTVTDLGRPVRFALNGRRLVMTGTPYYFYWTDHTDGTIVPHPECGTAPRHEGAEEIAWIMRTIAFLRYASDQLAQGDWSDLRSSVAAGTVRVDAILLGVRIAP